MKAAVVHGKSSFAIRDVPTPVPRGDEVLIRVRCCGVCGSDLHIYKEGAAIGAGHEYAGDIVEVGPAVGGWKVGDRVAVEPRIACGTCDWCARGNVGLCDDYYAALLQYEGAYAEYARTRYTQLHRLADDLSYEHAALAEPTACALHAVALSGLRKGEVIAVLGLGPIGQLVARVGRSRGAQAVYGCDSSKSRITLVEEVADAVFDITCDNAVERVMELTGGRGPDRVFECSGSATATQDAVALVRKGGTIVIPGICFDWVHLPVSNITLRELTVRGSICFSAGEYAAALAMIRSGAVDVAPLVTGNMPLERINEAFETAARGEGGKIMIAP